MAFIFYERRAANSIRPRFLPNRAAVRFRTNHCGTTFATERLLKFRQVGKRPNHAILADGMRVALDHGSLRFRTDLITAPLSPGNKELLLWRVTIDGRLRVGLLSFLESEKSDLDAGEVADAFSQNQLAIVVNAGLNEIAIELADNAGGSILKPLHVYRRPPVVEPAFRIKLRALVVKAVADLMPNYHADAAIIDGVCVFHAEGRLLQDPSGEDDFVH